MNKYFLIFVIGFTLNLHAEVLIPYQTSNKLKAIVSVEVSQDPSTSLYTYKYTLKNDVTSEQSIDNFAFEVHESTPVVKASAPYGWSHGRYTYVDIFSFSSTEGITEEHVFYFPNGGFEIRSPYNIKPGASLCCFIFKTFSAPEQGNIYIQGYAPTEQSIGHEGEDGPDFAAFGIKSDHIVDNSFATTTMVPKVPLHDANRRPAIDGFVVPINFNTTNKDEFYAPIAINVAFGVNSEKVFTGTFKAMLNGMNITNQFAGVVKGTSSKNIILSLGASSPLQLGTNTLVLSVLGVVPKSDDEHAVDKDRITFKVLGGQ